jgi:hypothetical protein
MSEPVPDMLVRMNQSAASALRNLRWGRQVSMEQCADLMEIALPDFLAKERGRSSFTAAEFEALAMLLDLEVDELRGQIGLA